MDVGISAELNCCGKYIGTAERVLDLPAVPQVGHMLDFPEFEFTTVARVWWDIGKKPLISVSLESSDFIDTEAAETTIDGMKAAGWTFERREQVQKSGER